MCLQFKKNGDILNPFRQAAVVSVTELRLANLLALRSTVISAPGRYNQKCSVVENECV